MQTLHRMHVGPASDLSVLEDGSVDLVVTSPPYPMIAMWDDCFAGQDGRIAERLGAGDGPGAFDLMHLQLNAAWREVARVLRPGGYACINIGDATRSIGGGFRLYTNHARIVSACEALGLQSLPAILWRKPTNAPNKFMGSGMLPAGAYVTLEHEYILILRKGGKRTFTPTEAARRSRSAFFWEERNAWFSDVWDLRGVGQRLRADDARARSAAFPFELAFRLICMYSMQEDLVLDPFLGTGTTTAAAIACARNSYGVETDAALLPVIRATVESDRAPLNDRQIERLRAHTAFLRDYRAARGSDPAHTNTPYGFPVVTRQETTLELYGVTSVVAAESRPSAASATPHGEASAGGAAGPLSDAPAARWVAHHELLRDPGAAQLDLF